MNHVIRTLATCAAIAVLVAPLAGCGKKPRPDTWGCLVSGTVSIDGQPLDGGTITFIPLTAEEVGGRPGIAKLEADGSYWVGNANLDKPKGLKPGKYKIVFLAMEFDPTGTGAPIADLRIPEALTDAATTPFECDVEGPEYRFDFDLHQEVDKLAMHRR